MIPVVLVAQMHVVFVYLLYPPVAERGFTAIASQILDHRIGPIEIGGR